MVMAAFFKSDPLLVQLRFVLFLDLTFVRYKYFVAFLQSQYCCSDAAFASAQNGDIQFLIEAHGSSGF